MSEEYKIPADRLAWHNPVFDEVVQHLKSIGVVENSEAVVKAELTVETGEPVIVSNIVTENV